MTDEKADEKESGDVKCEETIAENMRLERELRRLMEDNGRLRSEAVAAREKFDRAHENWRAEIAKINSLGINSLGYDPPPSDAPEVNIEIPGVLKVHMRGPGALQFVGIKVQDAKTEKMDSDISLDDPS